MGCVSNLLLAGRPAGWVCDAGITHAPVVVRPLQAAGVMSEVIKCKRQDLAGEG